MRPTIYPLVIMNSLRTSFFGICAVSLLPALPVLSADRGISPAPFAAVGAGNADVSISRGGEDYLRLGSAVWGPNWGWAGVDGKTQVENGVVIAAMTTKLGTGPLKFDFRARQAATNQLVFDYELSAGQDTPLTLFVVELAMAKTFEGRAMAVEARGKTSSVPVPLGLRTIGDQVTALRLTDASGAQTLVRLDPPCDVSADGAIRLILARDKLAGGAPRKLTLTMVLPAAMAWYASAAELPDADATETWYPWRGVGTAAESVFDMTDWLEKPAGKFGRITRRNDKLMYHAQPIKLWGINLCYGACSPEKGMADKRAALYPRYGINTIRLHKFADGAGWNGIQAGDSVTGYDAAGLDRMDYQVAKFKEAGIYVDLSAHFGAVNVGAADMADVPYAAEFGRLKGDSGRISTPHSAFFYSPELQNLQIRQMVNLLKHRNPYTGLTYAADPAVFVVEIINEQSILFFTSMDPLKQSATLRKNVGGRFSDWLKKKYGSHDGLIKAWGEKSLDGFQKDGFVAGEHLDKRNILPLGNPWYWDPAQINGSQSFRKQRLFDTIEFLCILQTEAYERYVAALREAGYQGEILGSNWQAGRAYSHYANLYTDYRVGLIDRHNYFGGGGGRTFNAGSMLARPGSGVLSSGLQQVGDRPFMMSEWIHVFPSEWGVEGPALIGAYAMGLQGWDVSYLFQNGDNATFSRQLGNEWDAMVPQILGVFPAVSRQVLRNDVRESDLVAARNIHMPSVFQGKLGFDDTVAQGYDDKELDSSKVPARVLAVARCVVNFTPEFRETPVFDLKPHMQDGFLVSATKQLRWKDGPQKTGGFFTMNTPDTKAVVGFAIGQTCALGEATITPQSKFAAVYLTALDKSATIANAKRLLVVAIARARNTGMKFGLAGNELLARGAAPLRMEPVKATITMPGHAALQVNILDHDGVRTGKTLPVKNGVFTIDGTTDQTPYYEVVVR